MSVSKGNLTIVYMSCSVTRIRNVYVLYVALNSVCRT